MISLWRHDQRQGASLENQYRGASCFLMCYGPSLHRLELSYLAQRGILLAAVNNGALTPSVPPDEVSEWYGTDQMVPRPHLWFCADSEAGRFDPAIWLDAAIQKFVPLGSRYSKIPGRTPDGKIVDSKTTTGECANVWYYDKAEAFNSATWLKNGVVSYGCLKDEQCDQKHKGKRSVLLVALKLLWYLGVKEVFLLGCDFKMEPGKRIYATHQDSWQSKIKQNNGLYKVMNDRLAAVRPHLEAEGVKVWNCTEDSGLKAFDYMPFTEAVDYALENYPKQVCLRGYYERYDEDARREIKEMGEKCRQTLHS